jgi:hypothetical protein
MCYDNIEGRKINYWDWFQKKSCYLFINYNVVTFKVHPLCLHTSFLAVLPLFLAFLDCILMDVILRPGCLLLTQNGVLSMPF